MPNIRGIMVFVATLGFAGAACDFHEKSLASEARVMPRLEGSNDRSPDRWDQPESERLIDPHVFDFGSGLECVSISSTGSYSCQDAGGYPSTCATAQCPFDHTLTGGGGACAAGDRRIKSLFPRFDQGEYTIACEEQGVDPQAIAICCRL
jgi:hypothetical protein